MELITERLNAVVDALERSLTDKPDKEELSRIARCSYSDLNSLFLLLAEVTVAEYVRKRRLTLAGVELKYRDAKVLDNALKYGYDSPVSFARAFQSFHGFNPNAARREDCVLGHTPRLHFSISVKGVMQMIRTDKITVDGKEYEASYFSEEDISSWFEKYQKRAFWRLENAFDDFRYRARTGNVLPYNNYPPMDIQTGQVFVIDYTKKDRSVEREYFISDGSEWEGLKSTVEVLLSPMEPLRVDRVTVRGKEYDAAYYGEQDLSAVLKHSLKREFRKLLDTGKDFGSVELTDEVLPYNNYPPVEIRPGDVFEVTYFQRSGEVVKGYYLADGTVWESLPCTRQFKV
ncbi:MAG: AraC family transcriptional regulator [Clostridiales bacterium]|nr:AraC family transcriptional regulator [Clostridiales bacterium]